MIVGANGKPVASPEQRMFQDLIGSIRMTARELERMGVDVRALMSQPIARGWFYPVYVGGVWEMVIT